MNAIPSNVTGPSQSRATLSAGCDTPSAAPVSSEIEKTIPLSSVAACRASRSVENAAFIFPQSLSHFFTQKERLVEGLFYKIKDEKKRTQGYFLGTMHFQEGTPITLDPKIQKAFGKANILAVELHLYKLIPQENHERAINNGCIDLQLIAKAIHVSKEVVALEELQKQVKVVQSVVPNLLGIGKVLTSVIEKAKRDPSHLTEQESEILAQLKYFKACWIKGDEQAFEQIRSNMEKELTDERDALLAEKIEKLLQKRKKPFIGIGTIHLVAQKGVISLLREKGWTVVKVDRSRKPTFLKKIKKIAKAVKNAFTSIKKIH